MKKPRDRVRLRRFPVAVGSGAPLYLFLILACLLFTQALRTSVSAMAWIFVLLLPPADLLCLFVARHFVSARVEGGDRVITRGDRISVPIRLRNDGLLPVGCVEVVLTVPDLKERRSRSTVRRLVLPPFSESLSEAEVAFDRRGYYTVGVEEVFLYDYFRLLRVRKRIDRRVTVRVLPRRLPTLEALPPFDFGGLHRADMTEQGLSTEYGDIRQFRPGDGMKQIHWKLSTKLDELQVRKYVSESDKELSVFADFDTVGSYRPFLTDTTAVAEDRVVEEALSAACAAAERGISGRLFWYENAFSVVTCLFTDPPSAEKMAHSLSEAKGDSGRFFFAETSDREVSVLYVAAYLSLLTEENVRRVKADAMGSPVAAVLISLEDRLPPEEQEDYRTELDAVCGRLAEIGVTVTVSRREGVALS